MPKLVGYFFGRDGSAMTKPYKSYEEQLAILESRGLAAEVRMQFIFTDWLVGSKTVLCSIFIK